MFGILFQMWDMRHQKHNMEVHFVHLDIP